MMDCPVCGAWTHVLQTKLLLPQVRRRRYVCANNHRFWTREELEVRVNTYSSRVSTVHNTNTATQAVVQPSNTQGEPKC